MEESKLRELLFASIEAAEKASIEILHVYNSKNFEIEAKDDNSPLTLADKKSNECILQILTRVDKSIPVLSEEGKSIPFSIRKDWNYLWMADPLDGTKEFIKKNGEFTVNIALIEGRTPILGVVAVPVTGKVYYGARGIGAYVKEGNQIKALASPEKSTIGEKGIRVVASRSHMNQETEQFIQSLKEPVLVSKGSSLKFMLLAENEADIYPRFAPTMEWDTAAAHAIINQVGFKLLHKNSSSELTYNKEDLLNPFFICK